MINQKQNIKLPNPRDRQLDFSTYRGVVAHALGVGASIDGNTRERNPFPKIAKITAIASGNFSAQEQIYDTDTSTFIDHPYGYTWNGTDWPYVIPADALTQSTALIGDSILVFRVENNANDKTEQYYFVITSGARETGGCTEVNGDGTWTEQDSTDLCQVNHIGPSTYVTKYRWECNEGVCALFVDGSPVGEIEFGVDEKGHVTSASAPTDPGYYCTLFKRWSNSYNCSSPEVPDSPELTEQLCLDYTTVILGIYGGWGNCNFDASLGVTICEYISGPYATLAECQATGCEA